MVHNMSTQLAVHLNDWEIATLDGAIAHGVASNRADAIHHSIRKLNVAQNHSDLGKQLEPPAESKPLVLHMVTTGNKAAFTRDDYYGDNER